MLKERQETLVKELSEREKLIDQYELEIRKRHNQMLKERQETLVKELSEREKLIDQYELEIRKRHNQIEKKQLYVDRLNREFDEKRSKQEDDNSGPMEGKIKGLRKQIADKTQECQ